jgi:hypothetical protein
MASTAAPRVIMRSLSQATPSFRTKATRVATRCLHQKASPITTSPIQHRPRVQRWAQNAAPIAATVARRTMFIQTEPTPNADVCASFQPKYIPSTDKYRPLNSTPTSASFLNQYPPPSLNTSTHAPPSLHHTPPRSQPSSSMSTASHQSSLV